MGGFLPVGYYILRVMLSLWDTKGFCSLWEMKQASSYHAGYCPTVPPMTTGNQWVSKMNQVPDLGLFWDEEWGLEIALMWRIRKQAKQIHLETFPFCKWVYQGGNDSFYYFMKAVGINWRFTTWTERSVQLFPSPTGKRVGDHHIVSRVWINNEGPGGHGYCTSEWMNWDGWRILYMDPLLARIYAVLLHIQFWIKWGVFLPSLCKIHC